VAGVNTDALEGDLVRLPLVTQDEATLMVNGETLPWWADGYPRKDDLDAVGMIGRGAPEWSVRHVIRRSDGQAVGTIGFFGPPEDGRVEMGYGLVESARRQGLISDAVRAMLAAATAAGADVIAHTTDDNIASRATLTKFGFTRQEATNDDGENLYTRN